jgi:nucleoside-diphosphate-sugar epimerase
MRIYITGATGYVGSRLVPRLLNENHEITCLLRSPEDYIDHDISRRCRLIKGDITDRATLKNTMAHIDVVLHLAVSTPLTNIQNDTEIYNRVNVIGTANMLDECLVSGVKRIMCFTSSAAIGIAKTSIIDENTPLNPVNNYGRSKRDAEGVISSFVKKFNSPVITICFPHIYGPGDRYEFIKVVKMIKRGIMPQVGLSPNLLPSVYISDAVDAIILALEKGKAGEKYIVVDDDPHDMKTIRKLVLENLGIKRKVYPFIPRYAGIFIVYLLEFFFRLFGYDSPVKTENLRSITTGRRLSNKKAKKYLGFIPMVSLEEGIKKTVEWYKLEGLI